MNKITLIYLSLILLSFINPVAASNTSQDDALVIEGAWISEAPPVSRVMVAYLTIKNTGSQAIEIIRAESALYSSIEFHETIHRDGMASMVRHESLEVPANGSIELKRGGKHLMLFNPTRHLKAGETVDIKFTTKDNITKTVSVNVIKKQHK